MPESPIPSTPSQSQAPDPATLQEGAVLGFLKSFSKPGSEGAGYLEDHVKRFVETLRLVPPGAPGKRILELGAAFHHLTPAFARFCGYTDITCTDLWEGEPRRTRRIESLDGSFGLDVQVDNFDLEKDPYPYEDASFDTVICCEILEHLSSDPMHMLREINRITRPGGHFLLTTPNSASAKSLSYVLQGESPYIWGQYPVGGRGTDRHNREYTALEVGRILQLSGFAIESLATAVSWWPVDPKIMDLLAKLDLRTDLRGDNTLVLGRRAGPPQARYPAEFYHGGDVGKDSQGAAADAAVAGVAGPEAAAGGAAAKPKPEAFVADAKPEPEADAVDAADVPQAEPSAPLKVLVVNNILPNHDRGGSCFRMMTLLRLMREEGHAITYLGRDGKGMERYVKDLEAMGVRVHATDPARLRVWDDVPGPSLDLPAILSEGGFDVAILVLWFWSSPSIPEQYLAEIRRLSPSTRIVVLSDDVHWLHDVRMASVTGQRSDLERGLGYRPREKEIYRAADMVATITDDDAARVRGEDPLLTIEVLPHYVPPREGNPPSFESRRHVVTVGAFGYHANVDAAIWFAREVWPIVRECLPGVRFRIVGGAAPPAVKALALEDIEVVGWVPDLTAELDRSRVFVSAIRYGTGLKTKNIQAMAAGLPVVGTTISLEGSGARGNVDAVIEDDPRAFAAAVVRLYTDEAAWTAQASAGRALARTRFGRESVRAAIRRTLATASALEAKGRGRGGDWSIARIERRDPAIAASEKASDRFRARLSAHLLLAGEHFKARRAEDALEELRRVLAHCGKGAFASNPPFFAGVMCRFGDAYRIVGKDDEAAACYREALELEPNEDDALIALHEMEERREASLDAAADSETDRESATYAAREAAPMGAIGETNGGSERVFDAAPSNGRFRAVTIEGRRRHAFLVPAQHGDHWKGSLGAYIERFSPRDDVSLLLLGPAPRLEQEILSWIRAQGIDEESVPDVLIVPPPRDDKELPRFVAAADALLLSSAAEAGPLAAEARRQRIPVLLAGRDDLSALLGTAEAMELAAKR